MLKTTRVEGAGAGEVVVVAVGAEEEVDAVGEVVLMVVAVVGLATERGLQRLVSPRQKRRNRQVTSENGPWSQMVARMSAFVVPRPLHPYNLLRRQRSTTPLLHSFGRDKIKCTWSLAARSTKANGNPLYCICFLISYNVKCLFMYVMSKVMVDGSMLPSVCSGSV